MRECLSLPKESDLMGRDLGQNPLRRVRRTTFDRIALISIPVKDQKAARAFYTEKLGCTVKEEMPFGTPDTLWIRLALPGVNTELVLVTWFPQMKPGSVQGLVLTTKNICGYARETESAEIGHLRHQETALGTRGDVPGSRW